MGLQYRSRPETIRNTLDETDQGITNLKKTGNIRAVQLLLGHTKLESTVRYLGIEVDDALAISEQVELQTTRGDAHEASLRDSKPSFISRFRCPLADVHRINVFDPSSRAAVGSIGLADDWITSLCMVRSLVELEANSRSKVRNR